VSTRMIINVQCCCWLQPMVMYGSHYANALVCVFKHASTCVAAPQHRAAGLPHGLTWFDLACGSKRDNAHVQCIPFTLAVSVKLRDMTRP
jgi:hypothetical protein